MKLWLDDLRRPPDDSWFWARELQTAKDFLAEHGSEVVEASLDHDLGGHDLDPDDPGAVYVGGNSQDGSGYDLVCWMVEKDVVPKWVTVHSMNPVGAMQMAARLSRYYRDQCQVTVKPFTPAGAVLLKKPTSGGSPRL